MRIAYMTGEYPRATDTFIQREVAALRDAGAHVETFSIRQPDEKQIVGPEQRAERDRTHYVLPWSIGSMIATHAGLLLRRPGRYLRTLLTALRVRSPGLRALIYQVYYFVEAGRIASLMDKHNLAHLHNHFANSSCSVAMLASELGGFSYSYTVHGPAIFFEPARWNLREKVEKALFVSCISHYCRSQVMIRTNPTKWNRLHIVHCGVDPDLQQVREHGDEENGGRLLFVGRLAAVKGLPILLEAVARLKASRPEIRLDVIGDGPERSLLESLASALGISDCVDFLGYRSQEEVRQHLTRTDVFVMASFAEGVPVVLMEAMSAGVAPVATRIAGVSELVEDGVNGLTVPPGDMDSLLAAIERLLDDASLRARLGRAGREKVQREFNINREAAWLRQIMTGALDGAVLPVRPPEDESAVMQTAEQDGISP